MSEEEGEEHGGMQANRRMKGTRRIPHSAFRATATSADGVCATSCRIPTDGLALSWKEDDGPSLPAASPP